MDKVINRLIEKYKIYADELQIHHNVFISELSQEKILALVKEIQVYKQFIADLELIKLTRKNSTSC
jgi:hypothetical protein